jgi:hypothetical protein
MADTDRLPCHHLSLAQLCSSPDVLGCSRVADVRQRLEKAFATLQASSDDVTKVLQSIDQALPDGGPVRTHSALSNAVTMPGTGLQEIGLDALVHDVATSGQNEVYERSLPAC